MGPPKCLNDTSLRPSDSGSKRWRARELVYDEQQDHKLPDWTYAK
jgi:hypothetical protein